LQHSDSSTRLGNKLLLLVILKLADCLAGLLFSPSSLPQSYPAPRFALTTAVPPLAAGPSYRNGAALPLEPAENWIHNVSAAAARDGSLRLAVVAPILQDESWIATPHRARSCRSLLARLRSRQRERHQV